MCKITEGGHFLIIFKSGKILGSSSSSIRESLDHCRLSCCSKMTNCFHPKQGAKFEDRFSFTAFKFSYFDENGDLEQRSAFLCFEVLSLVVKPLLGCSLTTPIRRQTLGARGSSFTRMNFVPFRKGILIDVCQHFKKQPHEYLLLVHLVYIINYESLSGSWQLVLFSFFKLENELQMFGYLKWPCKQHFGFQNPFTGVCLHGVQIFHLFSVFHFLNQSHSTISLKLLSHKQSHQQLPTKIYLYHIL